MDNNKKSELAESEKLALVLEEFNGEQQALNKTITDLVTQVNLLSDKINSIKKELDKPRTISVNTDTKQIEQILHFKLKELMDKIPVVIPVRHHFDMRSKGFIIGTVILLIVTAGSAGLSLSLWCENKLLNENGLKFRIVRQISPLTARLADSIYDKDPAKAAFLTQQAEVRQQTLTAAETKYIKTIRKKSRRKK